MPVQPRRFELSIPQNARDDLRLRLAHTRFPDEALSSGWSHGADLTYMRELAAYWRDHFDWRAAEAQLNAFPQYKVDLAGIGRHSFTSRARGRIHTCSFFPTGGPDRSLSFLTLSPG